MRTAKKTIPRACIVSENNRINEVRGIMNDKIVKQHLDDYIIPMVEKRLASLPNGEKWSAQMKDMKRLAIIHLKYKRQEELSQEDLRFLYEIDDKIHTTGYNRDPLITNILKDRDLKYDLSYILGVTKDRISTTKQEALTGNIVYHYGDIDLTGLISAERNNLKQQYPHLQNKIIILINY